jgi:thiol-disulfide isomerase/thioredoxin
MKTEGYLLFAGESMLRHALLSRLWLLALAVGFSVGVPACGQKEEDSHKALLGKPAPDFKGEFCLNGKPIKLSDLKGKVVLLDFWAVWCGPCVATFPHLREWHKEYKDKGLELVGVTTYFEKFAFDRKSGKLEEAQQDLTKDQEQEMLKAFAAHHKLEYRLMVLSQKEMNEVSDVYKVEGIPQAVLIDRKGVVRMVKVGAEKENVEDLAKMIQVLIAEKGK